MKGLLIFTVLLTLVGGLFVMRGPFTRDRTIQAEMQEQPSVRLDAGGAKFVRPTDTMRPGVPERQKDLPRGAISLIGPKENRSGLALRDLKQRQRNEAAGLVSQRPGSASLPQNNDVPRVDALRID